MGKLQDRLEKQLKTEYKQDAEDCLKIYNKLKEITGHVWQSEWTPLVQTTPKGWNERLYKPTAIGYTFLKGLECQEVTT